MKTYVAKDIENSWYVADAAGQTLGRFAARLAFRLRGKHKPEYTPFLNTGDNLVVINVEQLTVTGRKAENKKYYRHSSYLGGLKTESFKDLQARKPAEVLRLAVKGMLPKGPLGRQMLSNLRIYAGAEHPHTAQQPQILEKV